MSKLVSAYGKDDDLMNKRFVTMSLLSFSAFLRFNEVAKLRRSDLRIESDHVQVFITKSKTDQYGKGKPVIISATGKESCPVKMLIDYLQLAGIVDGSNEFIFRNIFWCKKKGKYQLKGDTHIAYGRARDILLQKLSAIGLDYIRSVIERKRFSLNKGYHPMKCEGSGLKGTQVIERKRFSLFGSL